MFRLLSCRSAALAARVVVVLVALASAQATAVAAEKCWQKQQNGQFGWYNLADQITRSARRPALGYRPTYYIQNPAGGASTAIPGPEYRYVEITCPGSTAATAAATFWGLNNPFVDVGLGSRHLNSSMTNNGLASAIPFPNTPDRISPPGTADLNSNSFYGEIDLGVNLMHVPTPLFVTNGVGAQFFVDTKAFFGWGNNSATVQGIAGTFPSIVSPANSQNDSITSKATYDFGFLLQPGIKQNWFGIGNTSIYGEFGFGGVHFQDTITCSPALGACGSNGLPGFSDTHESTPIDPVWGFGVVQRIDAAAMEIYGEYKRFAGRSSTTTFGNSATSVGVTATFDHNIDIVTGGARIRF
jgi:hypothetical protein